MRAGLTEFWNDPDRRRAGLLSLAVHLGLFLLVILWMARPQPERPEQFIVLDLGTPAPSEQVTNAPTVDDPAPQAPVPQVADDERGQPQARTAEQEVTAAPEPETVTEQPAPQPAAEAPAQQEVAEEPEQAEEELVEQPEPAPSEPEPELAQAEGEAPRAPVPEVREPTPQAEAPDLPVDTAATTLPEIDEVEVSPSSADLPIFIPQPQATARLPEARSVAVTASAEVSAAQAIPTPSASIQVAEAQELPQPQVQAQVAAPVPVPAPEAAVTVAEATTIPQPQASSVVTESQAIPTPGVAAQVASSQAIPQPQARAQVAREQTVPLPSATAQVAGTRPVPVPGAAAQVAPGRSVGVTPQLSVNRPVNVPTPQVTARVEAPQVEPGAAMAGAAPEGAAENPSNRLDEPPFVGGNADRSAQDLLAEDSLAGNLGRATGPEGDATGAPLQQARIEYQQERERPLSVLLDNVNGYPQAGLQEASVIVEMPVEGGLTRLMPIYDLRDPSQVGPIRSARDYFVELAGHYDSVLVHDGGSPQALAAISRSAMPTLNAYSSGNLFSRQEGRSAPYNLYSSGTTLREAINRLRLDPVADITGFVPRPPEDAPEAGSVQVRYGGTYTSGFTYIQQLDAYRWVRNGENAVDFQENAVTVQAVLHAQIEARPFPDDPLGRLYIPLRGGDATLYLRGRAITGSWGLEDGTGVTFTPAGAEEQFDLTPFKLWILFAPASG